MTDPDQTAQTPPAGWEGLLDPGERIVWQGRPDTAVVWTARSIPTMLFGVVFAGFALFWMIMASEAPGNFWMFGLIHFAVGVGLIIGPTFWSAYRRRNSWYTLTDRRAFIATDMPPMGRRLKSYPIDADTVLEFDGNEPGTIHFAHEYRRSKNGSYKVNIGFERVTGAAEVYGHFRAVQRGEA